MDRPTRAYIEGMLLWAWGTISTLGYSVPRHNAQAVEPGGITSSSGGVWGPFCSWVARACNFHDLLFYDEVRAVGEIKTVPTGFPIRLPSTGPSKVQSAIDQVFVGDPLIQVDIPQGHTKDETRQQAEEPITAYLDASIQAEEREGDASPLTWQKFNTIAPGLGARLQLLDITRWPKEPVRKRGEADAEWQARQEEYRAVCTTIDPIVVTSIHPLNVCYDRTSKPPRWAAVRQSISPWDAVERYPFWASGTQDRPVPTTAAANLVMFQYWTDEWYWCSIDGQPALGPKDKADAEGVAPNPYGFIPLDFSPGGHGHQDPEGRPEIELAGMYRRAFDLLVAEAVTFTLQRIYEHANSGGPRKIITGPDDPTIKAQLRAQLVGGPSSVVEVPPGFQVSELGITPLPQGLIDQMRFLQNKLDQALVYDIASGAGPPAEAARRTSLRLHQIDKQLATAALNIEQSLESSLVKRLRIIKHVLKKQVSVNRARKGEAAQYVTLHPDDIPAIPIVTVRLTGETDEEKQAQRIDADARIKNGTLDKLTAMTEYYKDRHPENILSGLLSDSAFPQIQTLYQRILDGEIPTILAEVARERGILFTDEALQAALPPPAQPAVVGPDGQPIAPQQPVLPQAPMQPVQPAPLEPALNGAYTGPPIVRV